jgi:hypothetical protein
MRRAMAGCESSRDDERRDLAAVPSAMPNAARFRGCDPCSHACCRPTSNWLPLPVAATVISSTRSNRLDDRRKPKRDETMWGAVANRKSGGDNWRRNLAAVPESLPGATRINDKRSPRRLRSSAGCCANAIGFIVSVAAASRSARWEHRVDRRCVGARSSVSCPGSTVVWVNEHSHIYHFPGTRDYGHTKSGAYMCEAEAQTYGNRAAMNERHP